ncbi:uncharacterized protein BXZ73DRAFT_101950 [Epithele typhae]|uniref:uncharacterized protein n=1 Tax=Epithele typhae TaxID=378194 RepID=UPI002007D84D|nr:uncharacterized protein BXZ73DRAFT_101950 [Epithele typhae]KAH9929887.1 hypothetical protein BXZ73DRAFT_101950 [Epithele typhae]
MIRLRLMRASAASRSSTLSRRAFRVPSNLASTGFCPHPSPAAVGTPPAPRPRSYHGQRVDAALKWRPLRQRLRTVLISTLLSHIATADCASLADVADVGSDVGRPGRPRAGDQEGGSGDWSGRDDDESDEDGVRQPSSPSLFSTPSRAAPRRGRQLAL